MSTFYFYFSWEHTLYSREHGVAPSGVHRADQDSVRVVRKLEQLVHLHGGGRAEEQAGTGKGDRSRANDVWFLRAAWVREAIYSQ